MRVKFKLSSLKKICLILILLSISFQSVYLPSFAAEEYETIREFLDEYDPAVEYGTESQLLPKEGDDVERFLDLLFEDFPDLTEDQILRIVRECGRDISCWEAMASSYAFTNAEESGTEFKGGAFRRVWEGLKSVGRFVGSFVSDVWHTYREGGVRGLGERAGGRVKGFVRRVWGGVKSRGRKVWDGITGFFGGIWRGASESFRRLDRRIRGWFERRREKEKSEREKLIKEIRDKYGLEMENGDVEWTTETLTWTKEVLEKLPDDFYDSENLRSLVRDHGQKGLVGHCGVYLDDGNIIKVHDRSTRCSLGARSLSIRQSVNRELNYKILLTHELTHVYVTGKGNLVGEFADFSWEQNEVQVTMYEKGERISDDTELKWVRKMNAEKGVSSYAEKEYIRDEYEDYLWNYSERIGKPGEDLADSVAYYVYNPSGLSRTSMKKYNFIRENIFDGKEF